MDQRLLLAVMATARGANWPGRSLAVSLDGDCTCLFFVRNQRQSQMLMEIILICNEVMMFKMTDRRIRTLAAWAMNCARCICVPTESWLRTVAAFPLPGDINCGRWADG
jgi:hypothetical protein